MSTKSNADFCHLHVHSEYSKFDGLAPVTKLVMKARQMGFPALALTDHGTVGGWIKFIAECHRRKDKKTGLEIPYPTIKPLLGQEFYLARDHKWHGVTKSKRGARGTLIKDGQPDGRRGNRHLLLLAQNWKGYQNLCRLSELAFVEGMYYDPRIDIEQLAEHSEGIICQSACLSSVINNSLLHDNYKQAKQACIIFKDIFKERFILEVMFHGIPQEAAIIADVLKLGAELGIPVAATNDTHYIEKPQGPSHECLMCMSTSRCILDPKRIKFPYDEFYLKSAEEMNLIFGSHPQLLHNTLAIADMVDADDIVAHMGGMRLPRFKLPPGFKTPQEYLEHLAWSGMKDLKWDQSPDHVAAVRRELADVNIAYTNNGMDFPTYMLMEWEFMDAARKKGILPGPGRGSGYASVLLRALKITYGPDPLKYGLIWERFLGFDSKYFINEADMGLGVEGSFSDLIDQVDDDDDEDTLMDEEETMEDED